jgi:hypothetical protein
LLLSSFFLLFQASLLSGLLILGLILPTFVLDYAVIFLHGKTTPAPAGRSYAYPAPSDGNWDAEVIEGHAAIKSAVAALIKNLRMEYDLEQTD